MPEMPPAGWHPDPLRRFEQRYWDGQRWTGHVASHGQAQIDPVPGRGAPAVGRSATESTAHAAPRRQRPAPKASRATKTATQVRRQVEKASSSVTHGATDIAIYTEPILVIHHKAKRGELRAEYSIYDRHGVQLATARIRRGSSRVQVVDMLDGLLMELREESTRISSKTVVVGDDGARVGRLTKSVNVNQLDRCFKVEGADGKSVGAVYTEDRRTLRDFLVQDKAGSVVARIGKTRPGSVRELVTRGDNYVVEFPGEVDYTLRLLSIATAFVVDQTYHQR